MASKVMMARGRTPLPGEVLIHKALANTFRQIVRGGTDVFYRGEIAQKITEFSRQNGGLITKKDLEDFQVEWHDPLSIPYKEYKIYCPPPPCSGFQYLEMLNILETDSLSDLGHNSTDYLHLQLNPLS